VTTILKEDHAISFRESSDEDIDLIIGLWHELDNHVKNHSNNFAKLKKSSDYHQYIMKWINKYYSSSDALILVAEYQGELCGFISTQIQYMPWYHIQRIGLIGPCYVKPLYRRRGIAKQLVSRIEKWLVEKEIKYIDVIWDQGNFDAQKFWQNMGYDPAQVRATKRIGPK